MEITTLTGEECNNARTLWEEVFWEDTALFTEYYFQEKAKKNTGYVMGQAPYNAMMFRTPYRLQIGKQQRTLSYLVGVATKKEYRHQGCMRKLLLHSFEKMYEEKQPFTFLMPANPAIYEPFGFRYIYERDVWKLKEAELEKQLKTAQVTNSNEKNGLYRVSQLQKQYPQFPVMNLLADFANETLKKQYQIYVSRDAAYYEMQLKESLAQNGDIYVLFQSGVIWGFFLYAKEGSDVFIQEVLEKEEGSFHFLEKTGEKKPVIMARIIHLEEMMKLVKSKIPKTISLCVEDELIPQNCGIYQWEIGEEGSNVIKQKMGTKAEISMHISELAPRILTGVFLNEIV